MDWIKYFYNIAEEVKKKSKDKNTQIGAVIVGKAHCHGTPHFQVLSKEKILTLIVLV